MTEAVVEADETSEKDVSWVQSNFLAVTPLSLRLNLRSLPLVKLVPERLEFFLKLNEIPSFLNLLKFFEALICCFFLI